MDLYESLSRCYSTVVGLRTLIDLGNATIHLQTYISIVAIGKLIISRERCRLTRSHDKQAVSGRIFANVYQRYIVRLLHIIFRQNRYSFRIARQAIWLCLRFPGSLLLVHAANLISQHDTFRQQDNTKSDGQIKSNRLIKSNQIPSKDLSLADVVLVSGTLGNCILSCRLPDLSRISKLLTLQTQIVSLCTLRDFVYVLAFRPHDEYCMFLASLLYCPRLN